MQKTQNPQRNPQGSPQANPPKKTKTNAQGSQKTKNPKNHKKPNGSNEDTYMGEENSTRNKRTHDGQIVQSIENPTQGLRWSGGARPDGKEKGRGKNGSDKVNSNNSGSDKSGNINKDRSDNNDGNDNNDNDGSNNGVGNNDDDDNDDGNGNNGSDTDEDESDSDDDESDSDDDDNGDSITIQNFRPLKERPGHVFDLGKWKKIIAVRGIGGKGDGYRGHQLCLLHNVKKNGKKYNVVELVPLSRFGKYYQYKGIPNFKDLMLYPKNLQEKQLELKDIKIGAVFYSRRDDDIRKGKPNTFWWFTADKLEGALYFATNTTFKQCFGAGRIDAEEMKQLQLTGRRIPAFSAKLWTSVHNLEQPEKMHSSTLRTAINKTGKETTKDKGKETTKDRGKNKTSTATVNIQSTKPSSTSSSAAQASKGKGSEAYPTPRSDRSVTPEQVEAIANLARALSSQPELLNMFLPKPHAEKEAEAEGEEAEGEGEL
ncbi:MAG: hypothetical protein Q9165_008514 [Trypethelium subeluteriae]